MDDMTIDHDGLTYAIGENSVYIDSTGDRHPIHFITRPEGCLVRIGKEAIVLIKPVNDDSTWVVVHVGGSVRRFTTADETEVYMDEWLDFAFNLLPE